ncbi:hypothetical protein GCM10008960_42140 [Deinococcus sedimenti]|nr:hypothetical protein GCM10008960_42140 [Deinococcus sedimenti]
MGATPRCAARHAPSASSAPVTTSLFWHQFVISPPYTRTQDTRVPYTPGMPESPHRTPRFRPPWWQVILVIFIVILWAISLWPNG